MTRSAALAIRRGQLIAPFGVGALSINTDGVSMICAGLDYWFRDVDNADEFKVSEWRLERRLHKSDFRLPPDYREPRRGVQTPNAQATVPFFRFPLWHYCVDCGLLEAKNPYLEGRIRCPECEKGGKIRTMVQAPLVAICEHGHLQDFPWREWAHRSAQVACRQPLRLRTTGGASLAAMKVSCDCGIDPRPLAGATASDEHETQLSTRLDSSGLPFLCSGHRPWLGQQDDVGCGQALRGSQRSASNLYFADVASAIYLPRQTSRHPDLIEALRGPQLAGAIELFGPSADPEDLAGRIIANPTLRAALASFETGFLEQHLAAALRALGRDDARVDHSPVEGSEPESEADFRRPERDIFIRGFESSVLAAKVQRVETYQGMEGLFSRITLVERLRETRVLTGFSRVAPLQGFDAGEGADPARRVSLWGHPPADPWLPAYVVFGEGIFLELDDAALRAWESENEAFINPRIERLQESQRRLRAEGRAAGPQLSARFVLVHTLAHLLIRELTYTCGYSSASLRERLYVSADEARPMAGLLIYTAAGDSEGTLGGLVAMGDAANLEGMFSQAMSRARWCSADPVCSEIGARGTQGTDSLNLAACHNCGLLPETACEHYNRFLDRSLLIGDLSAPRSGFFSDVRQGEVI